MRRCQVLLMGILVAPALAAWQAAQRDAATSKSGAQGSPTAAAPGWLDIGGQRRARAEPYEYGGIRPYNSYHYYMPCLLCQSRCRLFSHTLLRVEHVYD